MGAAQRIDDDPIPVTVVTAPARLLALDADTVLLRLPANTGHGHGDGDVCLACANRADVRTMLFELLEMVRLGMRAPFARVVVDASALPDPDAVVAALTGRLPAQAWRDHQVARRFVLVG